MGCHLSVFKRTVDVIVERTGFPITLRCDRSRGAMKIYLKWEDRHTSFSALFYSRRCRFIAVEDSGNNPDTGWAWEITEVMPQGWYGADEPIEPITQLIATEHRAARAAATLIYAYIDAKLNAIADSIYPNYQYDIPF